MPEGSNPTPSRSVSREDEILLAACRVVVTQGAHALRIGTVAQEAGVSRTLVHYYFQTRRELLRATFSFAEDRRAAALEAELATLATGLERLRCVLHRTVDPELEENPALWNEVWSSARDDEELLPLVQSRYHAWADRIVGLLEEGKRDGSVPAAVEPAAAGWRLAAVADGVDSIRYLDVLDREAALAVLDSCIERELAG